MIIYLDIMMGFSRVKFLILKIINYLIYYYIYLKSSIFETVIICIFSAFVVKICIIIMGNLIDSESNFKKKLGGLFIFAISALGIWIILVMIAISE